MYQARSSRFRLAQIWSDHGQIKISSPSGQLRCSSQARSDHGRISSGQARPGYEEVRLGYVR